MSKKIFLVWLLALLVSACSTGGSNKAKVNTPVSPRVFYSGTEFPDIVIPRGLRVIQAKSMVVKTPSYIGGVLTLRGDIRAQSLADFFRIQLTNRGWKLSGVIRYKNILLAFRRPNGSCFVYISEPVFGAVTEIQIWASETLKPSS